MASSNTTSSAKTHVSLRLPTYILESIDAHAEKESISRTEAFVFYLQTGLDIADTKANEPSKDESMLQSIQDELAEIKAMLLAQQGGQPVQFEAIEENAVDESDEFTTSDAVSFASENTEIAVDEEAAENEAMETADETEAENEQADEAEGSSDEEVSPIAESEAFAESYFSGSDAVTEETVADDEEEAEEDFTDSDAVMEESSASDVSSLYAIGESESFTEIKPLDDPSDFTTSDAVYGDADADEGHDDELDTQDANEFTTSDAVIFDEADYEQSDDEEDDRSEGAALSHKKLEKAITKAAKDISAIEKVWLYGSAAEDKEITDPAIDLCVKTEDDDIKPKHLEAFVAAIEEKTGKLVNVVLRHEVSKEQKQTMKNKVELYKK